MIRGIGLNWTIIHSSCFFLKRGGSSSKLDRVVLRMDGLIFISIAKSIDICWVGPVAGQKVLRLRRGVRFPYSAFEGGDVFVPSLEWDRLVPDGHHYE